MANPDGVIPIPVDLFVSKKHPSRKHGDFRFLDSDGVTVFKVDHRSSDSSPPESSSAHRVLTDSAGSPLLSMHRHHSGSWQCFREGTERKELVFRVQRTKHSLTRTELDVFFGDGGGGDSASADLKVKGLPFQRSCTIYTGADILAQTSLMYKLNQFFPKRGKFRLTIFPASDIDHSWIVALVVMFLHR